jgi:hypothetical protein
MHFSLAAILVVVPLLASATPITDKLPLTIPLNKRTNIYRHDGSIDFEIVKRQAARSTA